MEESKLSLDDLKVESFVTDLGTDKLRTIEGGNSHGGPETYDAETYVTEPCCGDPDTFCYGDCC